MTTRAKVKGGTLGKTGLDANFERLNADKFKANVLYYLRAYSTYDVELHQRRIKKKDASGRIIASKVCDINKDNATKSIKILKEQGIIEEQGQYYIINDLQGESFRSIDTDFVKWMLITWDSRQVMTYIWLHRRWEMYRKRHVPCTFTLRDIVQQVFRKDYWNGALDKEVSGIVQDMIEWGVINVTVRKVNDTFIKQLVQINECVPEGD